MRASEILRNLADLIDSADQAEQSAVVQPQQLELEPEVTVVGEIPTSKFTPQTQEPSSAQDANVFVPPLQAKIELLKKAVNVDNIYDQQGQDELDRMKKLSGINVVATDEAASDEPLDV